MYTIPALYLEFLPKRVKDELEIDVGSAVSFDWEDEYGMDLFPITREWLVETYGEEIKKHETIYIGP